MADSKKTKKELIEAVEALQESEKKWHSLAENAPNIIMVVDRDGIIQFVNRTPPDFTIEEAIGKNIYDYLSPEHCKVAKEAIEQVFQTGKPTHYENIGPRSPRSRFMVRHASGSHQERWACCCCNVVCQRHHQTQAGGGRIKRTY